MHPLCAFLPATPLIVASSSFLTSSGDARDAINDAKRRATSFGTCRRVQAPVPAFLRRAAPLHSTSFQPPAGPATGAAPTMSAAPAAPLHVIIAGAPASGKGTQCAQIVNTFSIPHISTGDMLRAAVKAQTPLGISAKEYMDAGALVPDELVIAMLKARISEDDCLARGWLLDGFPRTQAQAVALDEAGVRPDAVVVLDVSDDVLVERVVGRRLDPESGEIYHVLFRPPPEGEIADRCVQRSDDTEEKARARLQTFHKNKAAIEAHYSDVLERVDGERAKEIVFHDIEAVISIANKGEKKNDKQDGDGDGGGTGAAATQAVADVNSAAGGAPGSSKGMPVAEFVRRAEEAYEKGYLSTGDVNWSGQAAADSTDSGGTGSYKDISLRLDVALGDSLAILLFAYIGNHAHASEGGFLGVMRTAAPFLTAWFLAAPLLRAYTRESTQNALHAAKSVLGPASVSAVGGVALRGFLALWRALYAAVRGPETDVFRRGGPLEGLAMVTTLLRRW